MAPRTQVSTGESIAQARPTPAAAPRNEKLHSLTGLRFIAAFLVVLCHVGINLLPNVARDQIFVLHVFYGFGSVGVSFFFILSGFVLTWVARETDTVPQFWRRRFFKIYPNHLVTLLAAVLLAVTAAQALSTRDTLATMFLVHAWIPDQSLLFNLWSNTPSWSLSCELLFYLAFPFVRTCCAGSAPSGSGGASGSRSPRSAPCRSWRCCCRAAASCTAAPGCPGCTCGS